MTVDRFPLSRWRYPISRVLEGRVFPLGRPPFAPFPSVSNMINAYLCPVALVHDLIHGMNNALSVQYPMSRRGNHFHDFISEIKILISSGTINVGVDSNSLLRNIQSRFTEFSRSRRFQLGESTEIWSNYIEPWVSRKIQESELQEIKENGNIFFEVSVANDKFRLPLANGNRKYPLNGRIDEINISKKKIIERTIKENPNSNHPPLLKDYQVWLYWKLLCSIDNDKLPSQWRDIDFSSFDLVVETPTRDYNVKERPEFINNTHSAFAWIDDIGSSESTGVFREAYENARCSPENPDTNCSHPFINCFPKSYPYPRCRPEIRQTFQPWYRLLLWERMWKGDLWKYRTLILNNNQLKDLGLIEETNIISMQDNEIKIELSRDNVFGSGYDDFTIIPFGTLHCGIRLDARLNRTEGNRLILKLNKRIPIISDEAILLESSENNTSIMRNIPLTFLDRGSQQALFKLKTKMGAQTLQASERRSIIQLLESIFGTRNLSRG